MSELGWADLRTLIDTARVPRAARLLQVAKDTVKRAKSKWPAILRDAPDNLRPSIEGRLAGGVVLAR